MTTTPLPAEHLAAVSAAFGTGPIPRAMFESVRDADLYADAYTARVSEFVTMSNDEIVAYLNASVRLRRKACAIAAIGAAKQARRRVRAGGAA